MASEGGTSKLALAEVLESLIAQLEAGGELPGSATILEEALHYRKVLSSPEATDSIAAHQHRLMLALSDFLGRAERLLAGEGVSHDEDLIALSYGDQQPLPKSPNEMPVPIGSDEQPLCGDAVSSMSSIRIELELGELAAIAADMLAGRPVRLPLASLTGYNDPQQIELLSPGIPAPLLVVAEMVDAPSAEGVLLSLKPWGDSQSGWLLALAAEADPTEPIDEELGQPVAATIAAEPAARPLKPSREALEQLDDDEDSKTGEVIRLGRYQVIERIAYGGMATVYLGKAVGAGGFERRVAIKVMHEHIAQDAEFKTMFLDEARLAARIHHPNVVSTLDVQQTDNQMFLVMEYIAGPTLRDLLRKLARAGLRMPLPVMVRIFADALAGLHAAHELEGPDGEQLKLVHRDVSPHNILVGTDGITRITDFGVARAEARLTTTIDNTLKGRISYMAPEQGMHMPIDRRADVYSAGIVMWEALTGKRLFQADNDVALICKVLAGAQISPRKLEAAVPETIDQVCMKALALDPEQRFPTAQDFADALENTARACGAGVASNREVARFVDDRCGVAAAAADHPDEEVDTLVGESAGTKSDSRTVPTGAAAVLPAERPSPASPKGRRTLAAFLAVAALAAIVVVAMKAGVLSAPEVGVAAPSTASSWSAPVSDVKTEASGGGVSTSTTTAAMPALSVPQASSAPTSSVPLPPSAVPTAAPPAASAITRVGDLFVGRKAEGVGNTRALPRAGGVFVGLPDGWRAHTLHHSHLMLKPRSGKTRVLVGAQGDEKSFASKLDHSELKKLGLTIGYRPSSWESFDTGRVGPQQYLARTARGTGLAVADKTPRAAIVVVVKLPKRQVVLFLGAWPPDAPQQEKHFVDIVRGVTRCKYIVKRHKSSDIYEDNVVTHCLPIDEG